MMKNDLYALLASVRHDVTVEGVSPLTLLNACGRPLQDYRLFGRTVTVGTPTYGHPVPLQSCGEPNDRAENAGNAGNAGNAENAGNEENAGNGSAAFRIPLTVSLADGTAAGGGDQTTAQNGEPITERTIDLLLSEPLRGVDGVADELNFRRKRVFRKFAVCDLGSFSWVKNTSVAGKTVFIAYPPDLKNDGKAVIGASYCFNRAVNVDRSFSTAYYLKPHAIHIRDNSFTDAALFRASVAGVKLVYETDSVVEETVGLPTIPTFRGDNRLSVETTVSPSRLEAVYAKR